MKRKTLTPAQIASRDARRAKFRELAARVADLSDTAREAMAAQLPTVTIEGRTLSPHNACLVALQLPTPATIVGGFHQWRAAGRCVRKGEHGLMIWAPTTRKDTAEDGTESSRPGFIMVTVFDVSQTDLQTGASAVEEAA